MKRSLLFAAVLLATGVVLAGEKPGSRHVSSVAAAEDHAEAAQPQKAAAQGPGEEVHGEAQEPEPDPEKEEKNGQAEGAHEVAEAGAKVISGMSILGNQEAPKSLVIVPWKSSKLGKELGIVPMLDDSRQPVDREVFMRALIYYEIRSGTKP